MRHIMGVLGVAAATVLLAVSAAMNWKFGFNLGKSPFEAHLLGLASAAADCMKALIPFFLFAAIKNRVWSQAAAAGLLWLVVLSYSMTSALGFAALNRNDSTGERQLQTTAYQDLRKELKRAEDRLGWMPQHRPAAMVEQEISLAKKDRLFTTTKGCTEIPGKTTREYCQGLNRLQAELAVAVEASQVEAKVAEIKARLDRTTGTTVVGEADPQAGVLSRLTGQDLNLVQMGLVLLVAVLLELGSALGFYVAMSVWKMGVGERITAPAAQPAIAANENVAAVEVQPQQPALPAPQPATVARLTVPETDLERFYKERLEAAEGETVTATALYEDYCSWCEELNKEAMALPTFGRQFGELKGYKDSKVTRAKVGGRIRYIGIKLKAAGELDEEESLIIGDRLVSASNRIVAKTAAA